MVILFKRQMKRFFKNAIVSENLELYLLQVISFYTSEMRSYSSAVSTFNLVSNRSTWERNKVFCSFNRTWAWCCSKNEDLCKTISKSTLSPTAPAFRKHKTSADKTLPEGLQHLLAVIYVISNTFCIMQAKKGKGGGGGGEGRFTNNSLTPTLNLSLPMQKERQLSTTSTFVLNLWPEVLWKSLVSNMVIQSYNTNSMEIS